MADSHNETRAAKLVDWFIRSRFMETRTFGVSSDDCIGDGERWDRCQRAAEHGAEGSTHYEIISDWRSAWDDFVRYGDRQHTRNVWSAGKDRLDAIVSAHFDALEAWHEKNGTLHEELG